MITTVGDHHITLDDFYQILFKGHSVEVGEQALERVAECFAFLTEFAKDKLIYGINTGFGPMAQYRIAEHEQVQLQYNLIRSHCSGQGQAVNPLFVRALMIARMNTFLKGKSGVHPDVVELLKEFINRDICPVVFEHGSVGASGDLVQLAHLALSLIGEGRVWADGEQQPTADVLAAHGLAPLEVRLREGLALMNGTSAMTGVGVVNLINSRNLLNWSLVASAMISEIVESYDDHYSAELNDAKQHAGQRAVAAQMRAVLADSRLVRQRGEHLYAKKVTDAVLEDKVQEYYSIRCVPQILGPIHDTIANATAVVMNEVNSVSDNPVIDKDKGSVYHGGNFHGDYVSLEMDKLKAAITKLSMLSERQLNFLLNDKLNQKLPPFVNLGRLGFNLGMQGAQFVATSTVAENQTLSFPMYVHSIPNNNDNQDIVSMGTNAAQITSKVIDNTYQVLAVQMLTVLQAVDYLGFEDRLSSVSRRVYQQLRALVPVFTKDTVMYEKIAKIKDYLQAEHLQLGDAAPAEPAVWAQPVERRERELVPQEA
jgi:histidine ammonia-lyase